MGAVAAATEAVKGKDKKSEAVARLLLATALTKKAVQEEDAAVAKKEFKEAADAQRKAAALYKELDLAKEQANALHAVIHSLFMVDENSEAAKVARDVNTFTTGAAKATSLQLLATAHILQFGLDKKYLDGGEEEMLSSA